jgi:hypothetical protein
MEDFSSKVLAITTITNGVCVNDTFINLVNNLSSSMGRNVDYFSFNKSPNFPEVNDLCDKDVLDRLRKCIGSYEFILVDKRLDLPTLNVVVGFILSEGNQIGSFYIDDTNLQEFVESKVLLRKDYNGSNKDILVVSPDGSGSGDPVSISEALDCLINYTYSEITFLDGNYEMDLLYRVLAYCYDTGVIVVNSELPNGAYIRIIESKW